MPLAVTMAGELTGPPPLPAGTDGTLMRSLGRLVRGLSALFWGLPVALIVCFHTSRAEALQPLGVIPPLLCMAWLSYALWQMSDFQKQERVWRSALDRTRIFCLVMLGLSPFIYWQGRMPGNRFFLAVLLLLCAAAVSFLASLNVAIRRLGAMLPDEALRTETRQFTALNLNLLLALVVLGVVYLGVLTVKEVPVLLQPYTAAVDQYGLLLIVPFLLLPLAMTMAMLWKTKEVILDSVFGGRT